jgi:hypothetical protein
MEAINILSLKSLFIFAAITVPAAMIGNSFFKKTVVAGWIILSALSYLVFFLAAILKYESVMPPALVFTAVGALNVTLINRS